MPIQKIDAYNEDLFVHLNNAVLEGLWADHPERITDIEIDDLNEALEDLMTVDPDFAKHEASAKLERVNGKVFVTLRAAL